MPSPLVFADPAAAADALTFAQRATLLGDGAVRLRAHDGVMAMTSAPLAPQTLLEPTPTVLGMRFVAVDPELVCDLLVEAATLVTGEDPNTLMLPDTAVSAMWAGISPPRAGWVTVGEVRAAALASRAQWGIASVAETLPPNAGEEIVRSVRSAVWGPDDSELGGLPRGVAFAAYALGFIAGEEDVVVRASGPWLRLSLTRGHVLTRTTVRDGLTAVRTTGVSG